MNQKTTIPKESQEIKIITNQNYTNIQKINVADENITKKTIVDINSKIEHDR